MKLVAHLFKSRAELSSEQQNTLIGILDHAVTKIEGFKWAEAVRCQFKLATCGTVLDVACLDDKSVSYAICCKLSLWIQDPVFEVRRGVFEQLHQRAMTLPLRFFATLFLAAHEPEASLLSTVCCLF